MREIKFRVWDDYLQVMRGHTDPSTIQAVIFHQQLKKGDTGRYIIEQFTGLLDKNDKDIYEGDIVALRYYDNSKEDKFSIIFNEAMFILKFYRTENEYSPLGDEIDHIEIIGNIHERRK